MTPKLVFAPGCFDDFDGTQEELEELMADIQKMIEDGSFFEQANKMSPEEENTFFEAMKSKVDARGTKLN